MHECPFGIKATACKPTDHCMGIPDSYSMHICFPSTCPSGFRQRNFTKFSFHEEVEFCEDINECTLGLHNCNMLTHYCLNTKGSYICEAFTTTTTTTTSTTTTAKTTTASSKIIRRPYIDSRYNKVHVPRSSLVSNIFIYLANVNFLKLSI